MNSLTRADLEPAYILHARAYRETSQLLEVFTSGFGRVGIIANGARRPKSTFRGYLNPFQPLRLSWSGRGELMRLSAIESIAPPATLDGDRVMAGFYANELLLKLLQRGDAHPELFVHYAALVDGLAQPGDTEPTAKFPAVSASRPIRPPCMTPWPSSNSLRNPKRTRATPFSQYPSVIPSERLMGAPSKSCLSFSRWADLSFDSGAFWGRNPSGKGTGTSFGGGAGALLGALFTAWTAFKCLGRTTLVRVRRRAVADLVFDLDPVRLDALVLDRLDAIRGFGFFNSLLLPNPTSIQMTGTLGTGIVNVNHLDLGIEIKSGGTLLSVADSSSLDTAKRHLGLATGGGRIDVGDTRFDCIYETETLRRFIGED